ncbi:hypothetical protein ACFWP5_43520 [Streptomyces sp. NPDC058469]|uniref:hypothetical protein n=1 Tax=Streptomyces sp. NPDC058469 TaxID=3346514 RepID=UPI0036686E67
MTSDLTRAGLATALPFVDQVWQVYVLVFRIDRHEGPVRATEEAPVNPNMKARPRRERHVVGRSGTGPHRQVESCEAVVRAIMAIVADAENIVRDRLRWQLAPPGRELV